MRIFERTPDSVLAFASLLSAGCLIGVSTNLAKVAGNLDIPALGFLAWSILLAGIALGFDLQRRDGWPDLNRRTIEYFFIAAFVTVAASNLIFFSAVPKVGASFVSLAIAFPPLLTWLGALAIGMERFDVLRGCAVVTALAGAAWLAISKLGAPDAEPLWIGLTLLGPVLLAVGNLYRTYRWPPGASPQSLAPGMLLAAAAMLFATGTLPGLSLAIPLGNWRAPALVGVQAVVFAGQFLLLFVLQRLGGPVYLSLLGAVAAIFAVPIAVLLLNEQLPEGLFLGGTLIAIGVGLLTWASTRSHTRERGGGVSPARNRAEASANVDD